MGLGHALGVDVGPPTRLELLVGGGVGTELDGAVHGPNVVADGMAHARANAHLQAHGL